MHRFLFVGVIASVTLHAATTTTTTVLLAASPNPVALGQPATLTATVTGTGVPTGSLAFFANGNLLGASTVSSGSATLTTRTLLTGANSLIADYYGDATHAPSHSVAQILTVNAAPATGLSAPSNYATGSAPQSIITADLNSDGNADLITPNGTSNNISVLIGNGDGTFRPKVDYPTGLFPLSVIAADLNGDTKPDLIVANSDSTLTILIGNGDGTFHTPATVSLTHMPVSVAAGDFNQDSKTDLIVGCNDNLAYILLGNGDGTLQSPSALPGFGVTPVTVGDFNTDGLPDFIAGTIAEVGFYIGKGDGTFQYSKGPSIGYTVAADLNGDGKLDLIWSSNNYVSIALGRGDGTFSLFTFFDNVWFPASLVLADLNGDGKLDLFAVNTSNNTIGIRLGNGDGTFQTSATYSTAGRPTGIAVGDFNNDGRTDFATSSAGSNNVTVYLGTFSASLQLTSTHPGSFLYGQTGATYALTVTNAGPGTISGVVTVVDILPAPLVATSISGAGWNCMLATLTCTQTLSLASGAYAPPITITANVPATGPSQVTNIATASVPGATSANTSDLTNIFTLPSPTLLAPPNQQNFVDFAPTLSWSPVSGASSYDVYLGPSSPPAFFATTTGTSLSLSNLLPGVPYKWRVVANTFSTSSSSATWMFTTRDDSAGLLFTSQPANTPSGLLIPTVTVLLSNFCTGIHVLACPPATGATAPVTITSSPAGINTTVTALNATAVFTGLSLDAPGTYTLTATSPGLNSATSSPFTISPASYVTIFGQVTASGVPVSGANISINGSRSAFATTGSDGRYSIDLPKAGTYTLNAARSGFSFAGPITLSNLAATQTVNFTGVAVAGLEFYPVTPCRVADTRPAANFPAPFGPGTMTAGQTRSFPIPSSACGIPSFAAAYSLNFTAVPPAPNGYLGLLTTWPTGQAKPNASTLNSYTGTVVANAAVVPAGTNGSIDVYVSDPTDVVFDINGYFAAPSSTGLQFFSLSPCRVADTRSAANFPALFGAPTMAPSETRTFPVPLSTCGVPSTAAAYSFNFTVVPTGYLGLLTSWPAGPARPNASTLNSYTGTVVANAAFVPAGAAGAINIFVSDGTDVLFDINGYFLPKPATGLHFYPITPCRVADTRPAAQFNYPFGAPTLVASETRTIPVPQSACGIPANAAAYSLNFTVVPVNQASLGLLTTYPAGQSRPNASTLNSYTGTVVANAAIVPAGNAGAITLYVSDPADVIFDINGYFAP